MLFQRVGLKPMWCGVKVIAANAADEALGLWVVGDIRVKAYLTPRVPLSLWVAPRHDLPPYLPSLALVGLGARQKHQ